MTVRIIKGDCREVLRRLPAESVHCVVTSQPYWGLRDYGVEPTVWGGDEACEHEWDAEVVDEMLAKRGTTTGLIDGGRSQIAEGRFVKTSAFCRCGAWRGAFGLEPTYDLYVRHSVEVFREVRRVLRADGTLWLNLGDSYATGAGMVGDHPGGGDQGRAWSGRPEQGQTSMAGYGRRGGTSSERPAMGKQAYLGEGIGIGPATQPNRMPQTGLKPKDLCGIPWRVAFALQADGWWLRQDIIWAKPNPMPESITDRCTKAHEYLFLLTKSRRYFFDQEAILEPCQSGKSDLRKMAESRPRIGGKHRDLVDPFSKASAATNIGQKRSVGGIRRSGNKERKPASARGVPVDTGGRTSGAVAGSIPWEGFQRNPRSVWTVASQPFKGSHFATFPPALIEPCIKAGCPKGGTVLDPFGGAGTTGLVADRLERDAILVEINPEYAAMAERRISRDAPMFTTVATE